MTEVALSPGMAALILFGGFFILIALRVPDVAADIEPKCSKVYGSRDPFEVPPNEESFVWREVLSKIVDRGF